MPNCAVANCKTCNQSTKGASIKYFTFPKKEDLANQWVIACRREDKINLKNGKLVSFTALNCDQLILFLGKTVNKSNKRANFNGI